MPYRIYKLKEAKLRESLGGIDLLITVSKPSMEITVPPVDPTAPNRNYSTGSRVVGSDIVKFSIHIDKINNYIPDSLEIKIACIKTVYQYLLLQEAEKGNIKLLQVRSFVAEMEFDILEILDESTGEIYYYKQLPICVKYLSNLAPLESNKIYEILEPIYKDIFPKLSSSAERNNLYKNLKIQLDTQIDTATDTNVARRNRVLGQLRKK